jgi:hypothetical protein
MPTTQTVWSDFVVLDQFNAFTESIYRADIQYKLNDLAAISAWNFAHQDLTGKLRRLRFAGERNDDILNMARRTGRRETTTLFC